MKHSKLLSIFTLISSLLISSHSYAVIDADAAVVQLRKSCVEAGATINNCFTDITTLNGWMVTRQPSASSPLRITVGPGTFSPTSGQYGFECYGLSNIAIEGAGRGVSTITGAPAMRLDNCNNLSVEHISLWGGYYGIEWSGDGVTNWNDVELIGKGFSWYESDSPPTCDNSKRKHYWTASRLVSLPYFSQSKGYQSVCGEHWFYGSELVAEGRPQPGFGGGAPGTLWGAAIGGEAHFYGSVIRVLASTSHTNPMYGLIAGGGTEIHIHGTGIDMISEADRDVIAFSVSSGGFIHANEASYVLKTGPGATITRIENTGGTVWAPYLWPEGDTPPAITSVHGADMTVATTTSDNQPHLLIYSDNCTSNWFDTSAQACY